MCFNYYTNVYIYWPQRKFNRTRLKKITGVVKNELNKNYPKDQTTYLTNVLDELIKGINFNINFNGIGLFVSKKFKEIQPFYFNVKEQTYIGNFFLTRNILSQLFYSVPYFILHLTGTYIRLYQACLNKPVEIKDKNFPLNCRTNMNTALHRMLLPLWGDQLSKVLRKTSLL